MSRGLPGGFKRLLRLGSVERDVEEELASYFEFAVDDLMSRGYSRADAEGEAMRRFGDRASYRRELRAIDQGYAQRRRWRDRLDAARHSVGYALRGFARSPGLTFGIVLTFALGIGANATMYGIVERLLIATPPHVVDGEQVKRLYTEYYVPYMGRTLSNSTVSYPEYLELASLRSFSGVAGFAQHDVVVGRGETAEEASAVWATGSFFALLGVRPLHGRFFDAAEDRIGGARQAVLSHGYWQRKFGGARDVLGRSIDFGYGAYTIIGVAPRGFTGIDLGRVDFWVPLHVAAADAQSTEWQDDRSWAWVDPFARLAPGVSAERAAAEATAVHAAGWSEAVARGEYGKDPAILVVPLQAELTTSARNAVLVARLLFGVSIVVLLIACVNVANLMLARTIRQGREIAVRLALGISRARLIGQVVLEGVLLALGGGICAVAIYLYGGDLLRRVLLPDVDWDEAGITRGVILVIVLLAVVAGVLSAAFPALKAARGELSVMLRQAGAGGVTRTTARVRNTLSLLQTALSVLLLVGAGLFVRSLKQVQQLELGFEVDGLYQVLPRLVSGSVSDDERADLLERAALRIRELPGVRAAGVAVTYPFHSRRSTYTRAEGRDSIPRPPSGGPFVHEVGPGYLEAMGLRVLRGRALRADDSESAPHVALVNQSLARWLWPNQDPLGKCIFVGRGQTRCSAVVGVVEDAVHSELGGDRPLQYYVPVAQGQVDGVPRMIVVRVASETPAVRSTLLRELVALDPRIRYAHVEAMRERLAPQKRSWTLGATMFTVFGLLALVVASLGLYSVLAFDVAQRTREIGLRAALGASRRKLVSMVVQQSAQVTALGIVVGTVAALALGSRVQPLLFGVSAHDPVTLVAVAVVLMLVAALAGLVPGSRAARVDPSTALRTD